MSLTFDEARHRYSLDGKPVTGVTTIIGKGLPKPGLPYWSAKVVAEAAADEAVTLATTIGTQGRDAVVNRLKRTPWQARDRAAVRGEGARPRRAGSPGGGRGCPRQPRPLR